MKKFDSNALKKNALALCAKQFAYIDETALYNTEKVLTAYRKCKVSEYQFQPTTGYGYSDMGREKLDELFAYIFKGEKAIVRPHFVSGTHALSTVLFALLTAGDEMISLIGKPYDTMCNVIGHDYEVKNSLVARGIHYKEIPVKGDSYDLDKIEASITDKTRLVLIQRSRGYSERKSLSVDDIEKICAIVKKKNLKTICFIDNCYGEFAEIREPLEAGADIIAGSLIKNAGGGLAPTGGYIVGKEQLVDTAADYLTAPGLGSHLGSYAGGYRMFFQGLFMAPHIVAQAIKGAVFGAAVFSNLGFDVAPAINDRRYDLIQSIYLKSGKNMELFCEGLQQYSPVDAFVKPVPGAMPGYVDPIIMAGGTFVQGSSIELSADGPIREPYMIYLQGGLIFEHNMLALLSAAAYVYTNK